MKDFIEVHAWDDKCAPWMVRVKSISKITREKNSNRAIIYINDNIKMECVETYDWFKEILGQQRGKKVQSYPVIVSKVEEEVVDEEEFNTDD